MGFTPTHKSDHAECGELYVRPEYWDKKIKIEFFIQNQVESKRKTTIVT